MTEKKDFGPREAGCFATEVDLYHLPNTSPRRTEIEDHPLVDRFPRQLGIRDIREEDFLGMSASWLVEEARDYHDHDYEKGELAGSVGYEPPSDLLPQKGKLRPCALVDLYLRVGYTEGLKKFTAEHGISPVSLGCRNGIEHVVNTEITSLVKGMRLTDGGESEMYILPNPAIKLGAAIRIAQEYGVTLPVDETPGTAEEFAEFKDALQGAEKVGGKARLGGLRVRLHQLGLTGKVEPAEITDPSALKEFKAGLVDSISNLSLHRYIILSRFGIELRD